MKRPVRPPTRPSALVRPRAAPARAGPAAVVTRVRPCVALDVMSAAVCRALAAASVAVVEDVEEVEEDEEVEVDWKRRGAERRRARRAGAAAIVDVRMADIVCERERETEVPALSMEMGDATEMGGWMDGERKERLKVMKTRG